MLRRAGVLLVALAVLVVAGCSTGKSPLGETAKVSDLAQVAALLKADPRLVSSRKQTPDTALHWAAFKGQTNLVTLLLANGADVNTATKSRLTPLHAAAAGGDTNVVKMLLAHDAKVDARDVFGFTPLHFAAIASSGDVAKLLLAGGAAANARVGKDVGAIHALEVGVGKNVQATLAGLSNLADEGATPLQVAARDDNREVAMVLLANKAEVNARDDSGHTPLYTAALNGNQDVAALLIAHGAEVNVRDRQGLTPLHAAVDGGHQLAAEVLLAAKADVNAADKQGRTPLLLAAVSHNDSMVKLVRDHGGHDPVIDIYEAAGSDDLATARALLRDRPDLASVNILFGMTPLHWAVQKGCLDMAELLLASKADVDAKDVLGETALHYAARNGRLDIVGLLLASGAEVNARNKAGDTPYWLATCAGHEKVMTQLEWYGGNAGHMFGIDIYMAATTGDVEVVRKLLKSHPELVFEKKPRTGETPLHMAARNGHTAVVKLLLAENADANVQNNDGVTPLHYAAVNGRRNVVDVLLAAGANINAKDELGQTPLHMAEGSGRKDVAAMLRQHGGHY